MKLWVEKLVRIPCTIAPLNIEFANCRSGCCHSRRAPHSRNRLHTLRGGKSDHQRDRRRLWRLPTRGSWTAGRGSELALDRAAQPPWRLILSLPSQEMRPGASFTEREHWVPGNKLNSKRNDRWSSVLTTAMDFQKELEISQQRMFIFHRTEKRLS